MIIVWRVSISFSRFVLVVTFSASECWRNMIVSCQSFLILREAPLQPADLEASSNGKPIPVEHVHNQEPVVPGAVK